jgi:hypothetical protein
MRSATSLTSPRAVAYTRYSSEQQRAASIDDQIRNCRRRADAEGWVVIREAVHGPCTLERRRIRSQP